MDLIDRLRKWRSEVTLMDDPRYSMIGQAADEIEKLRGEILVARNELEIAHQERMESFIHDFNG